MLWSMCKNNQQWIWLAIDIETFFHGAYIGSRDIEGAKGLWDSLPPVYRQCAVSYTDFWPQQTSQIGWKRNGSYFSP